MTEKEFWLYLDAKLAQGVVPQVSGYIDSPSEGISSGGNYCGGHSVLFNGHDNLPRSVIADIGILLKNSLMEEAVVSW